MEGVILSSRRQIPDNRGCVSHFIKEGDIGFTPIKEVYITTVNHAIIKGWHGYISKTIHYIVPKGLVQLVLYDMRPASKTYKQYKEFYLGSQNYSMITIPPGIFNAFRGISSPDSLVVVAADEVFDEAKIIRYPIGQFDYHW